MRRMVLALQQLTRAGDWRSSEDGRNALEGVMEALHTLDQQAHRPQRRCIEGGASSSRYRRRSQTR